MLGCQQEQGICQESTKQRNNVDGKVIYWKDKLITSMERLFLGTILVEF